MKLARALSTASSSSRSSSTTRPGTGEVTATEEKPVGGVGRGVSVDTGNNALADGAVAGANGNTRADAAGGVTTFTAGSFAEGGGGGTGAGAGAGTGAGGGVVPTPGAGVVIVVAGTVPHGSSTLPPCTVTGSE